MLWPLILPAIITFWTLVGLLVVVTAAAPRFGRKRLRVLAWGILVALVAFVPSCTALMSAIDQYRFGVFTYSDFQSVNDFRVERYLPEPATEITVDKYAQGYRAKFTISKQALDDWHDQFWERYGRYSVIPRASNETPKPIHADEFNMYFGDLGWPAPYDAIEYAGPRADNGAGFTIWYGLVELSVR